MMNREGRKALPFAARTLALVVGLFAVLVAAPAVAQDARTQAKEAYTRGKQMFQAGNYTGAIAEFERAKQLEPSPVLDFNIGLAHDRAGNAREAVDAYRSYLRAVPNASNKTAVESRITALEPKIAEQMEPLPPPTSGPAEQAPPPATAAETPGANPPPGVVPPVAPPADAVVPDAAPRAEVAPGPPVDDRFGAPVAPRIPQRTGDPELDRVIGIDLASVRARFRGPAVGPAQR